MLRCVECLCRRAASRLSIIILNTVIVKSGPCAVPAQGQKCLGSFWRNKSSTHQIRYIFELWSGVLTTVPLVAALGMRLIDRWDHIFSVNNNSEDGTLYQGSILSSPFFLVLLTTPLYYEKLCRQSWEGLFVGRSEEVPVAVAGTSVCL